MSQIDLTITPEVREMIREMEWKTIVRCIAEGHQWIDRQHGQKQCRACGYYMSEVTEEGVPKIKWD